MKSVLLRYVRMRIVGGMLSLESIRAAHSRIWEEFGAALAGLSFNAQHIGHYIPLAVEAKLNFRFVNGFSTSRHRSKTLASRTRHPPPQ